MFGSVGGSVHALAAWLCLCLRLRWAFLVAAVAIWVVVKVVIPFWVP